ncbi:MAG: hypothetical protein COA96_15860 [SAR86 cluster bacterium]|uniref:Uncharacterized protein n=1 Tax=SAR86 cluster bacterium TaxID=2030880 RepID=A0A2A5AM11_9GAMM|nr:MAG: hypothetical protein COA96_15860 [SAR86 cluster bacterium]
MIYEKSISLLYQIYRTARHKKGLTKRLIFADKLGKAVVDQRVETNGPGGGCQFLLDRSFQRNANIFADVCVFHLI